MKSVVVEASTVAKAIESAWAKAGKPEEFFIRILQEHQSGFLGFGSQKAKVVLFFKNSQKSDPLFPVVVKQKEYTSFFSNFSLKVPTVFNVVDTELNKNVVVAGSKKKQPYNNQQQKAKNNHQISGKKSDDVKVAAEKNLKLQQQAQHARPIHPPKPVLHNVAAKPVQNKNQEGGVTQIKIQSKPAKPQAQKVVENVQAISHKKESVDLAPKKVQKNKIVESDNFKLDTVVEKIAKAIHHEPTLQAPVKQPEQTELLDFFEKKDDVVKDIARALKKVQSQKIVANVSRPASPKPQVVDSTLETKIEKAFDLVHSEKVAVKLDAQVEKPVATTAAPRVIQKLKRRPLSTENQGVSGITPRSPKPVVVSVEQNENTVFVENVDKKDSN
ncbi:Jag N-terminal domain-containing protein [Candidatus Babeliales bacterium]|nr:Jag N-terminal domain-containing protein [Candidatus Babeliales bacterium]MBP9843394.1 Jag N-terminal domain-containing protein [Candidatus Babeliales bacterium]